MRLAQTLLDRHTRVCSTMRPNRGIPCDLEGEVSVAEERWHNCASVEGQENKHGSKEALCCCPVQ